MSSSFSQLVQKGQKLESIWITLSELFKDTEGPQPNHLHIVVQVHRFWCYVPDLRSTAFGVNISPTQTVDELREAIHGKIGRGIAVSDLVLWKVSL
jgi:hypothetical protein